MHILFSKADASQSVHTIHVQLTVHKTIQEDTERRMIMNPDKAAAASIFGIKKYVEYQPGQLNVIISIPHGGYLSPPSIPHRDAGCFVNGECVYAHGAGPKNAQKCPVRYKRDKYTKELGFLIAKELTRITQLKPHIVINHLSRRKVDVNAELDKGTFGVPEAVEVWKTYHGFIEQAKRDIPGAGLLIDVHGQSHPEEWVELGYTLNHRQLNDNTFAPEDTSIHSLARRTKSSSTEQIQDLIFGQQSFGALLAAKGHRVFPSPAEPILGESNYYPGGYITQTHGSRDGGVIDAIQLETPKCYRNADGAPQYAVDVASTIHEYLKLYYNKELKTKVKL